MASQCLSRNMKGSNNNSYPKTRYKSLRLSTNFVDEHNVQANGKDSKL